MNTTTRDVQTGPNWAIEFDEVTNDYNAYEVVDGQRRYLGSRSQQYQARQLISATLYPDPR